MGIGDRIKSLRHEVGATQQAFADTIGLKRNTIANYEIGNVLPSDRTIADICREFNVNEAWLRTGDGEMFAPKTRNEELFEFAVKAAESPPSAIQAQLLAVMSRLTDDQWEVLAQVAHELYEEMKKADPE